jgi:hypothetical protein
MTTSAIDAGLQAEAEQHIRGHVEGERARVERVSRIRELVLSAQDGLLMPLGVVSGMAAANPGRTAILVAGSPRLSPDRSRWPPAPTSPPRQRKRSIAPRSRTNDARSTSTQTASGAELALALENEGLPPADAERVAAGLASNPNVFLRTKVEKELGLS